MAPKLSIITPSFNQAEFLERTIKSVLDQGYPNLEYVVVDGGSTDESVEIIKRYEDRLAWWVSEPDEGQTDAINKGIARTSGEIVAYINSDDYYLPGAFEKAVAALQRSGASWMAGSAEDIEEGRADAEPVFLEAKPPQEFERPIRGRHWWVLRAWHVPQPSSFWRRELFERLGDFRQDMHFAFDAEFMLRSAMAGEQVELLPKEVLAVRSIHPAQKSADYSVWEPEFRQITRMYAPQLTPRERRRMRAVQVLRPIGAIWLYEQVMAKAVGPLLERGGDLLERLPERWRPAIRGRDRRSSSERPSSSGR